MGTSRDEFVKYPRTPHLFGSRGTDDDKHLGEAESDRFLADPSLIVEEKLDGTNVGHPLHRRRDVWSSSAGGTRSQRGCTRNTTSSSNGRW